MSKLLELNIFSDGMALKINNTFFIRVFCHLPFLNICEEILVGDILFLFTLYFNIILNILKIYISE
ncbi:hypothetical protein [Clostridium manihotivorum]|uniref:Uncharacterized protein n=1 Tax=Clostridium manihotivorum TaxID=2320868 RepID=A0A410DX28_9CLOT|nr:hypothetical protein [Clostridium manihotivorum]QAA33625.1 hypothetical protein C1I91_19380 [Clostridium manihotivorum]